MYTEAVDIEFRDKRLAPIDTTEEATAVAAATGLSEAVIKACRKRLNFIRSAPDERSLRNWRSLHYEKLEGDRKGQRSIRLNDQWRMILDFYDTRPPKMIVLDIEDYH